MLDRFKKIIKSNVMNYHPKVSGYNHIRAGQGIKVMYFFFRENLPQKTELNKYSSSLIYAASDKALYFIYGRANNEYIPLKIMITSEQFLMRFRMSKLESKDKLLDVSDVNLLTIGMANPNFFSDLQLIHVFYPTQAAAEQARAYINSQIPDDEKKLLCPIFKINENRFMLKITKHQFDFFFKDIAQHDSNYYLGLLNQDIKSIENYFNVFTSSQNDIATTPNNAALNQFLTSLVKLVTPNRFLCYDSHPEELVEYVKSTLDTAEKKKNQDTNIQAFLQELKTPGARKEISKEELSNTKDAQTPTTTTETPDSGYIDIGSDTESSHNDEEEKSSKKSEETDVEKIEIKPKDNLLQSYDNFYKIHYKNKEDPNDKRPELLALLDEYYRNPANQKKLAEYADQTIVLVHKKALNLFENFWRDKRENGTEKEKKVYENIPDVWAFIHKRLIGARWVTAYKHQEGETYIHKNGKVTYVADYDTYTSEKLKAIGKEGINDIVDFPLEEHQSEEEAELSALVSILSPTFFLNNGNRLNAGKKQEDDDYAKEGYVVGLTGARFDSPEVMENKYMRITSQQNSEKNGYGINGNSAKAVKMKRWADFYGVNYFPTYQEARDDFTRRGDNSDYVEVPYTNEYIHKAIFKERTRMSMEPILDAANQLAIINNDLIFENLIGAGQGAWANQATDEVAMLQQEKLSELLKTDLNKYLFLQLHLSFFPSSDAPRDTFDNNLKKLKNKYGPICSYTYPDNKWNPVSQDEDNNITRQVCSSISNIKSYALCDFSDEDLPKFIALLNKSDISDTLKNEIQQANQKTYITNQTVIEIKAGLERLKNTVTDEEQELIKNYQTKLRVFKLLATVAADGSSAGGNEFHYGNLSASGDPAMACCSGTGALHNQFINEKLGTKVFVGGMGAGMNKVYVEGIETSMQKIFARDMESDINIDKKIETETTTETLKEIPKKEIKLITPLADNIYSSFHVKPDKTEKTPTEEEQKTLNVIKSMNLS